MAKDAVIATLSFAARPRVVAKHLGQLLLVVSALTLVPVAVAILDAEADMALRLGVTALVLAAFGAAGARLPGEPRMQANEALAIVALSYMATAGATILPFMAHGLSASDALFESVSGITTTGLSTITHVEGMPRSYVFLRAWMQWYGGLGIVVLSVALLVGDDAIARRLVDADLTENLVTTTRLYARRMIAVYVALTAFGLVAIASAGVPFFDAVCHALAAVSTGGFSTYDRSLAGLGGPWPRTAVMGVCIVGAVPLALYLQLYRRRWKTVANSDELRALAAAILAAGCLIFVFQGGLTEPGLGAFGDAMLLAVSAQTTAGFARVPPADLGSAAKLVVIVSMMVGGCIGSTAGSVKLLRTVLGIRTISGMLRRTSLAAGAVDELRSSGRPVQPEEVARAATIVAVFVVGVLLSWLPFLWRITIR